MSRLPLIKNIKWNFYNLFLFPFFFFLFFLYVLIKINPALYYQGQEPVFFFDSRFFHEFLSYPGGPVEYISAFLSQFYYYPWIGALLITLIAWLVSLSSKSIIKSISNVKQVQIAHLIPAVLLLFLHNNYDHQLSIDIGLLISLGTFNLFTWIVPQKYITRLLTYLLFSVILYFLAGGQFFLFVLLSIIFEFSKKRFYSLSLIYVLIAVLIPYIAASYFFIFSIKDAYLNSLAFENFYKPRLAFEDYYRPELIPFILYGYFPFIMIASLVYNRVISEKNREIILKSFFMKPRVRYILQVLIIFAVSGYLLYSSFNENKKIFLRVDYYARRSEWQNLLNTVTPEEMDNKVIAYEFNRALYHTGKLADKMFTVPQPAGAEGLILPTDIGYVLALQKSDLFFELGHLNEAEHWVCEALAHKGNTPWNLQRLALITILKSDYGVANKCLNLLDKTLLFRGWAKQYRSYINNNTLINKDSNLRNIKSLMPDSDFIVISGAPDSDLKSLLEENKSNRMAYEYMMAYYLMKRQLNKFITNLNMFTNFGYKTLPRHYQEAILAYVAGKGKEKFNLPYHPDMKTINDFKGLWTILGNYKGNKDAAYNSVMQKYGNTYWAYLLYK